LGIARLEGLRRRFDGRVAVWPFDTNFAEDLSAPIICAEIYPSSHAVPDGPAVKDQRQVEAVLSDFLSWDAKGSLREKLNAPDLTGEARHAAQSEEGWVVGL
jgi:precorrin-8X/cobalt-precorrin-8 methylmutase